MKRVLLALFVGVALLAPIVLNAQATPAPGTTCVLRWRANPVGDSVVQYIAEYRKKGTTAWSTVTVPAGDSSAAGSMVSTTLPMAGKDVEVRVRAQNAYGVSEWTPIASLPGSISLLQFVFDVVP